MKILFMGTPDFAAKSLEYLANSGMDIVGVISQPDRPKGRGHKLQPTDVKVEAAKHNYSVYQPETLKNGAIHYAFRFSFIFTLYNDGWIFRRRSLEQ